MLPQGMIRPSSMHRPADRLVFSDLVRGYGRLGVLAGVGGGVAAGGCLLVSGANGAGKSTLLRCLAGLLRPSAGTIELWRDGRLLEPAERRLAVGYVAPDLALSEPLTCEENLRFFARLRGVDAGEAIARLAGLGVPPSRLVGALSSGMRQRLRWCWALLHRPRLLLLDEPFGNLDVAGEASLRALLADHLDGGGLAVVASPGPLDLPGEVASVVLPRRETA